MTLVIKGKNSLRLKENGDYYRHYSLSCHQKSIQWNCRIAWATTPFIFSFNLRKRHITQTQPLLLYVFNNAILFSFGFLHS